MKPALTAEEWAPFLSVGAMAHHDRWDVWEKKVDDLYAQAALCLHGQPFGFTHEDVELLRDADVSAALDRTATMRRYESLADRIEALLPPE